MNYFYCFYKETTSFIFLSLQKQVEDSAQNDVVPRGTVSHVDARRHR
jgi:hypothetical protein